MNSKTQLIIIVSLLFLASAAISITAIGFLARLGWELGGKLLGY